MAWQAIVVDLTLAVKNGPAGMWHALSDPGRIAPYGRLSWWVPPLAAALVGAGVVSARRLLSARPPGARRRPSDRSDRCGTDAQRRSSEGGRLVDLDARRRERAARRGRR